MVRVAPRYDVAHVKRLLCADIDGRAAALLRLSHAIHARPETAFQERWAARVLADTLEMGGLRVDRAAFGVPTAFRAAAGPERQPTVIVCCEYDSLPGLGHACGHNIIAAAGVGAGLALAPLARRLGRHITVLGTPAEEKGGGKILLARRGAFRGAIAVMLVHPATENVVTPALRAALTLEVTFHGRASHAAMAPEHGRNALDAAILAYTAIASLRPMLGNAEQVNATVSTGSPPNVVPDRAIGRFIIRALTLVAAERIAQQVTGSCRSAARSVGCTASVHRAGADYDGLHANQPLAEAFAQNASSVGRRMRFAPPSEAARAGSTDLGTISHLAPTIHPKFAIAPSTSPPHTERFARFAISPNGDRAVLDGAKAMSMTVADLWLRPSLRRNLTLERAS